MEPSIDVIKTLVTKHLNLKDVPEVSSFIEGALNKLYAVDCMKGRFIFRASLPVAPGVKTKSQVATATFVRNKTNIPVPKILALDADLHNDLGFEWILMERVNVRPLHKVWRDRPAPPFFIGTNITLSIPRGPYPTTPSYINARIVLAQHFASKLDLSDEDDLEHYEDIQTVLSGIQTIMPKVIESTQEESSILCNRDRMEYRHESNAAQTWSMLSSLI